MVRQQEQQTHLQLRPKASNQPKSITRQVRCHQPPLETERAATSDNQASSPPTSATAMVAWAACWR